MQHAGLAIFSLFFGIALLDALVLGDWVRVAFWLAVGVGFVLLDWWGHRKRATPH